MRNQRHPRIIISKTKIHANVSSPILTENLEISVTAGGTKYAVSFCWILRMLTKNSKKTHAISGLTANNGIFYRKRRDQYKRS